MYPSGELYIHDVDERDAERSYRCQVLDHTTNATKANTRPAKIILRGPRKSEGPRVTSWVKEVTVDDGQSASLSCAARGQPLPSYYWFRQVGVDMRPVSGASHLSGRGTLSLRSVRVQDSGRYVCLVNNTFGEDRVYVALTVRAIPLCGEAEFRCINGGCISIAWRCDKDIDCVDGSDEGGCTAFTSAICLAEDFECRSGRCVGGAYRCNGDNDCGDWSDEEGCEGKSACQEGEFRCEDGFCINLDWKCDGDADCDDHSDERDCAPRQCAPHEFQCHSGKCIQAEWRCDGDFDCSDNSDEDGCAIPLCGEAEFRCINGGCISIAWRCDKDIDCVDGSDEGGCTAFTSAICLAEDFECRSGRCVGGAYRCNGDNDCGDWSDEEGCEGKSACQEGEFRCEDGFCINLDWKCDGDADCDDHSDERDCAPRQCAPHEFQCHSGKCIQAEWRCDGDFDCSDNSDEDGCGPEVACEPGHFRCLDGTCIVERLVCNGVPDCPDRSDESQNTTCKSSTPCREDGFPCQHQCMATATGQRCSCKEGYQLAPDGRSCLDVDECTYEGTCSQSCVNTVPSFQCLCKQGYRLRDDKRHCKAQGPEAYVIFANGADIRRITMDKSEYTSVVAKLQNAVALDYHFTLDLVFWSDITVDVIRSCSLTNGTDLRTLVSRGLANPGGLAVDWIMNRVYWTDSGTSRVESVDLDGRNRRALVWKDLDKPRAIVLYPQLSTVYWTDWGARPRIERIYTDGSDRRSIVDTSLFWPNGLTIDYASDRIFWADAKHHQLESADLDGSNRKKLIESGLPHPFAVTIFEDTLYWTDWQTKSIHTASKFGHQQPSVLYPKLSYPMDIKVVQSLRQPEGMNPCTTVANKCSHICVSNNESATCACPSGLNLLQDGTSCMEKPDTFLLFTHRGDIRRLCLNCSEDMDVAIPLRNATSAVALDWDSTTDSIFWTDVTHHSIQKAKWSGENQEVVIGTNAESAAGLALDWVNQKLYWTDAANDRIEVANVDGSLRAIMIYDGLDKPRGIVVDPIRGYMYWTDWGDLPKIERATMAGQHRSIIVQYNLTWPNALAMDYDTETLYWTDAATKTIELINLATMRRKVLLSHELPHPFGLTIFEGRVYWTDWDKKAIQSADSMTGENRRSIIAGLDGLMNIHVFHRSRPLVPNPCASNNGGCSHLCLIAPKPKKSVCACPTGTILLNDTKTCSKGMRRFLLFSRRTEIRKMSLDVPYWADVVVPLKKLRNVVALDVDSVDEEIYYADADRHVVQSCDTEGRHVRDVISFGLDTLGGLAVDSVGRKLYWSDSDRSLIEVSELDGRNRHVLFWKDVDSPRAIALHYEKGVMFWTDWGNKIRIETADMDGDNRMNLVHDGLGWPHGLAIDKQGSRLIWADAKQDVIESVGLDGKNRRVLVRDIAHPYGVAAFSGNLYWTDWETRAIHQSRLNGHDGHIIRGNLAGLMDLRAIDTEYAEPDTFLLFTHRGDIRRLCLNCSEDMDVAIPLRNATSAVALDWDSTTDSIFWTDVTHHSIQKAKWSGENQEVVIGTNAESAAGLALDWVNQKLYWTDAANDRIEVANVDGSLRAIMIYDGLDKPRGIVVDPIRGYMYWTDWGDLPKIERATMAGQHRSIIVQYNLTWPNALAMDYDTETLYWTDAATKTIELINLATMRRKVLLSHELPHPFGLTIFEGRVYWTDWDKKAIQSADSMTGENRRSIIAGLDGLMNIHVFHRSRPLVPNPCASNNGGCSHLCLIAPKPKKSVCACPTGTILLNDTKTCSKGMRRFLLFSRRTEIRKMSLDVPYWADVVVPLKKLRNVVALDVDSVDEEIYYADADRHVVQSCDTEGRHVRDVISFGLDTLGGLAVDSVGRKLYWSDSDRSLIEVSELDGRNRHVLFWKDVDSPRAIALHYEKGVMFWTDWGNKIRIETADMDGDNRMNLVHDGLGWPHGLAIDKQGSRLIWADAKQDVIESVGLDGKNRRVLVRDIAHPYGVAAFSGNLYWTDWETRAIHQSRLNGHDGHIIRGNLAGLMDLRAIDTEYAGASACGRNNGGCSHLCLRKPHGFSCACPTGVLLKPDTRTCERAPSAFLLFANRGSLREISVDTPDNTDIHLPLNDIYNAVAVDFHFDEWKLYYTDVTLDVIRRADLNGSNMEVVIDQELAAADGLALDWIAKNIYWTDSGRKAIEVARANGSSRKLLINLDLDEPRALALFPEKGCIFWSDWGKLPKIERSFMDGSARRVIIATELGWPNGLTIDYEAERLYWVDAQLDCIEFSDLNGKNRHKLIEGVAHPFGLTQYESHIYWTDWTTKAIERANKDTGAERIIVRENIEYLMEIKMVARSRQTGTNSCSLRNGGCSHLCFYRPQGHICACPSYPDPRHCSTFPDMTTPSDTSGPITVPPTGHSNLSTVSRKWQPKELRRKDNVTSVGSKLQHSAR
ncbi:low-density lipoprotein receptor-related protein 4 [Ixodes scapularis]